MVITPLGRKGNYILDSHSLARESFNLIYIGEQKFSLFRLDKRKENLYIN